MSKANSRRLARFGTRPASIKSAKALKYASDVSLQAPKLATLLAGRLRVTARVFYASERPDLDLSVLWDSLQGKIYTNDRQLREMHLHHAVDKLNPRTELEFEEIG
ncbi:MAG: hypothetical protein AAB864_01650 [Patescibacteria group bacterium]